MARQQGYIAMIPVFIPVPKNGLKHQVEVGRALAEVIHTKDLHTIISLPGARFHPPRSGKDIITRWTSVEAPVEAAGNEVGLAEYTADFDTGGEVEAVEDTSGELYDTTPDEPIQQDEATTTGRRARRSAAA